MTASSAAIIGAIHLDRSSGEPLYRQLYESLRSHILTGKLKSGTRLPSSRLLSDELDVSRNTVVGAYEQLTVEGYVESRVGAGTYVSNSLPEKLLQVDPWRSNEGRSEKQQQPSRESAPQLSRRGQALARLRKRTVRSQNQPIPFRPGVPALDAFPIESWRRLTNQCLKSLPLTELSYGSSAGYLPLREALASYLGSARGVDCSPEQILIVSGTQQAIALAVRVLLDPGDRSLMEDPGYPRARGAFIAGGVRPHYTPIDSEGIRFRDGSSEVLPRMAYVTPSHQYPLGITMSLSRRLELLDWAERNNVWILEDDYDSEYRYAGMPIPALQGLDTAQRVIYIGTFSKVLFPALRLGYLVLPRDLVEPFMNARTMADRCPPLLNQMVLTRFLEENLFERHIRRMRSLYERRHAHFTQQARSLLGDWMRFSTEEAGLHCVGWLQSTVDDQEISDRLEEAGISAPPLSRYCAQVQRPPALVLGYGATDEEAIDEGLQKMAQVFCEMSSDEVVREA